MLVIVVQQRPCLLLLLATWRKASESPLEFVCCWQDKTFQLVWDLAEFLYSYVGSRRFCFSLCWVSQSFFHLQLGLAEFSHYHHHHHHQHKAFGAPVTKGVFQPSNCARKKERGETPACRYIYIYVYICMYTK